MRRSDRFQATWRMLAALLVAACVPVAVIAGFRTADTAAARIHAANATKTSVTATVVSDPIRLPRAAGQSVAPGAPQAMVQWNIHGQTNIALVDVPGTAERGDKVVHWVDATGQDTTPPRSDSDAVAQGVSTGVLIVLATACGTAFLAWCADRFLARRHSADWADEWRKISPTIGPNHPERS
ncbi:hypothetical protein [Nocardia sp. NPDC005825]|uniref:Rv1733c family protein n=1 Tax=unclassified Nocardia TaxID=2637762 RepID=UPI0033E2F9A9